MWPFSSDSEDSGPTYRTVKVEKTATRTLTFHTVEVRWASDREPEQITGYISASDTGIAFQEVSPYARKSPLNCGVAISFNHHTKRFIPYENIEDWEITDEEEHEFSDSMMVEEKREVSDD